MQPNNCSMGQATACRVLLLLNLVGNLRWESASFRSALAPPTSMPPPGTRQLQLPGPLSRGDLCRNPGSGMGLETLNHRGLQRIPSDPRGPAAPALDPSTFAGMGVRGWGGANLHLQQTCTGLCFVNHHKNRAITKQRKC